jgi:outer membrane protein TolC
MSTFNRPKARRLTRPWLFPVALAVLSGCVKYQPRPIDPPRLEQDYRSRSLSDPGLRAFVEAGSAQKPASWPPDKLDLKALTLIAFYFSPALDVARSQTAIAQAELLTAGARVNPTVDTESGYNGNPEGRALFGILPQFMIETAGKRSHRILQAQRRLEVARLALSEEGWRLRSNVRAAFYEHLLARRTRDLAQAEEGIRAEIVEIFDKRLAVGEAARPEYDVFRVDWIRARAALRKAEGDVTRTLVALARAAGVPASSIEGLVVDSPALESPPAEGALPLDSVQRAGLLHRIDIRRLLADYSAAEAALQIELARQYPNVQLGWRYGFEDSFNRYILPASIPAVPVFHRNRGPIAAAEARRQQAERQFIALQAAAIGELEQALAQYRSALVEFEEAGRIMSVQMEREEGVRRALAAGEGDRLQLATARLQTVTAERARLDALARVRTALGALEDAVQQPLEAGLKPLEAAPTSPRDARAVRP